MYISFFGFNCKPFQLTPDPEFLFLSGVHRRALTYLRYGIRDNAGFVLLTGEIGAGKTTIIRTLIKEIPQEIRISRVNNTKVSSYQLISMINEDFGLAPEGKDKAQMLRNLTDFLIQQYADGGRAMIIIDEAQNLTPDLLEEIRLLSNLETDKAKLLQIVLIGQPELNYTLRQPGLEQLRQRIAINTFISRLNREETEAYILHRLKVAGNEEAVKFEEGVMDAVYDFSQGTPRLINMLCEFTLLAAFTDEKTGIDLDFIKEIITDLTNERPDIRGAAAEDVSPSSPAFYGKVKKALMRCHMRIQNLESRVISIQQRINGPLGQTGSFSWREAELKKKEEELHRRERELFEKEEMLKRKEENVRNMFEQNLKSIPFIQ